MTDSLEERTIDIRFHTRLGGRGENYLATTKEGKMCFAKVGYEDNPMVYTWIENEAKVFARLAKGPGHPNVITEHQTEERKCGDRSRRMLVLPFLFGRDLEDVIDYKEKLNPADALYVAGEACRGLVYWHRQGIVHRDVKPANIFLEGNPYNEVEGCQIKIIDGSFASIDGIPFETAYEVEEGSIYGTPYYMPPEVCSEKEIGFAADIYSLGATLADAVIGEPPFTGTPYEIMRSHIETKVPREKFRDMPKSVAHIIQRAMQKVPWNRFRSMEEMGEACEEARRALVLSR